MHGGAEEAWANVAIMFAIIQALHATCLPCQQHGISKKTDPTSSLPFRPGWKWLGFFLAAVSDHARFPLEEEERRRRKGNYCYPNYEYLTGL